MGRVFFKCGRPHFLAQKTSDFLKFMMCLHGQGGFELLLTFCEQGGGVSFTRFCADICPLTIRFICGNQLQIKVNFYLVIFFF